MSPTLNVQDKAAMAAGVFPVPNKASTATAAPQPHYYSFSLFSSLFSQSAAALSYHYQGGERPFATVYQKFASSIVAISRGKPTAMAIATISILLLTFMNGVYRWVTIGSAASQGGDAAGTATHKTTTTPIVLTKQGAIRGNAHAQYYEYLGIPYAAPPTGEFRWRPPRPAAPHTAPGGHGNAATAPFDATSFGPSCYQANVMTTTMAHKVFISPRTAESEDCLSLNIFTPYAPHQAHPSFAGSATGSAPPKPLLPVLVFIHGGMHASGSSSSLIYNPWDLVASTQKIVAVTLNYRLGIFGFMGSNAQQSVNPGESVGNYGLLDQLEALRWLKDNIAAFGGDTNNIALLGQSSGAHSVSLLQILLGTKKFSMDESLPKISKIIQSSGSFRMVLLRDLEQSETTLRAIAATVGCHSSAKDLITSGEHAENVMACMRAVDPAKLINVVVDNEWTRLWSPILDNVLFERPAEDLLKSGSTLQVPTLVTWTTEDGNFLTSYLPLENDNFKKWARKYLHDDIHEIVQKSNDYPHEQCHADGHSCAAKMLTDLVFRCPALHSINVMSSAGVPVYYFEHSEEIGAFSAVTSFLMNRRLGAFHASDLFKLFAPGVFGKYAFGHQLVDTFRHRFIEFLYTGVPRIPLEEEKLLVREGAAAGEEALWAAKGEPTLSASTLWNCHRIWTIAEDESPIDLAAALMVLKLEEGN